jgi:uncharacterized protein YndB with AHSA1/START domain
VNAPSSVRITRTLAAPIEAVFAAWTDPLLMSRWFFPRPDWTAEAKNELTVGGSYAIRMFSESGDATTITGVYREIEPPHRLVFTWNADAIVDTVVTLELRDLGGRTELTLTHEGLVEAAARDLTSSGWTGCLDSLARYLAVASD